MLDDKIDYEDIVINRAMDLFGAKLESAWEESNGKKVPGELSEYGIKKFAIPRNVVGLLGNFFRNDLIVSFSRTDARSDYYSSDLSPETIFNLNEQHIYYCEPNIDCQRSLELYRAYANVTVGT